MIKDTEGYICLHQDEITTELHRLVTEGAIVSVWAGTGTRNSFATSLSVQGKLEIHPQDPKFRIIVSEGTYTYFRPINVVSVGVKLAGFKDGAAAVIEITF